MPACMLNAPMISSPHRPTFTCMLRITIRWRNLGPLVEDPSCSTTSCHWQGVRFREDRPPGIFGGAVSGAGICLLIKPIIITTLALVDVCVCVLCVRCY